MEDDRKAVRSAIAGLGGVAYILSLVVWLMAVPISAAGRVAGWFHGGLPTTPAEYNLLGMALIVYAILGVVGTATLMVKLGDNHKLATRARNLFAILLAFGVLLWLLP